MSEPRVHVESLVYSNPAISRAFATVCAVLQATNARDLECDIQFGDNQYHFDVSLVAVNKPTTDSKPIAAPAVARAVAAGKPTCPRGHILASNGRCLDKKCPYRTGVKR